LMTEYCGSGSEHTVNMKDLFTNRRKNENPNHQLQLIGTAEHCVRFG